MSHVLHSLARATPNTQVETAFPGIKTDIHLGDSRERLALLPENSVDLIVTSPPYADQRKNTYGGVCPDEYVDWFLPISAQLLRVLKPTGTFILNIKEKVVEGERSTYVMELILAMRKQGWLWTEEFIWRKKFRQRIATWFAASYALSSVIGLRWKRRRRKQYRKNTCMKKLMRLPATHNGIARQ
jgi:DNA modification methylase